MSLAPVKHINKWLKNQYGADLTGRPFFRIVWSEIETEKRFSLYDQMLSDHIIYKTVKKLKEVKKYANPIYSERFILEKLIFGIDNPEIWADGDPIKNGTYEPIWVFRGPNDTYQVPTLKTVEFVIRMLLGDKVHRNQKMEDSDEESSLQDEIKDCVNALGGPEGDIASHLHTKSAIIVP